MMKNYYLFFILFFNLAFSQSPAGVWYFGNKAGINFNSGTNPVGLFDGEMNTFEGCATLCDDFGTLLFYTDGINIWNRQHQIMPNGTGLLGDSSSTQSAIIVPMPGSQTLYYVFTVDKLANSNGLRYNIVDMSLEEGKGDITVKNIPVLTPTAEKINVVKHANENDYWLISHRFNNAEFYAYQISASGLGTPVISAVGEIIGGSSQNSLGYLKSSPDGKILASANSKPGISNLQLFNFNTATGNLALISTTPFTSGSTGIGVYGLEFSNDSNLLYVTNIDYETKKSFLYQFNIESQNETAINNSQLLLGEFTSDANSKGTYGALQLAPNKKIYLARNNFGFLGVINNPDVLGTGANFNQNAFSLGDRTSNYGLPMFVTSLFDITFRFSNVCFGNQTQFEIPDINNYTSISWNFGDPASSSNSSNLPNPTHVFSSTGVFAVTVTVQSMVSTKTFTKNVTIVDTPVANQPADFVVCGAENALAFNLSEKTAEILGTQSPSSYNVTYYATENDADNAENPLANSYTNTANPQTIYARVQTAGGDCFDVTNFKLIINRNPNLRPDETIYYCKNDFPQTISLSAGVLSPSAGLSYVWSTGATSQNIQVNQAGNYTVTATTSSGCSSSRTIIVALSETASINFSVQGNPGNYSIVVNTAGNGNYVYALNNEFGVYQNSNVFSNVSPGEHTVFVKDLNECGTVSDSIFVVGFPNYFTPNGDGVNERWNIIGGSQNILQANIFDRYGKLVYSFSGNSYGWDGTYNGEKLPATDYWFFAKMTDGKEVRGHFSLVR